MKNIPSYFHCVGKNPLKALTVGQLLEQSVEKYSNKVAVISKHQNRQITFLEILNQSDEFAAGLSKLGLEKGDRLGIWAPNLIEWIIVMMACARLGLILVTLNPLYEAAEMDTCINKVEMKAIVCTRSHKKQDYYELLKCVAPELPDCQKGHLNSVTVPLLKVVVVITDDDLNGVYKYNEIFDLADEVSISNIKNNENVIQMDDACTILFTSGTTGEPKAAVLTHFNLVNNSFLMGRNDQFSERHHKICLQLPLCHVFGLNIGVLVALYYGLTLVLPSASYSPERSLDAIAEEQCTCIYGTPTMFVDLINCQRRRKEQINPELVLCGGANASSHLYKEIKKILNVKTIKSIYGMTETTGAIFQSQPGESDVKNLTTVGCLQEHVEAKVVDKNGCVVPMGTVGELCIRGYCTFLKYWGDEDKTQEMIGADKWLKTGDQFVLMEDGYGKIEGRYKDMINRGGENIFPKEIEDILHLHPNILEAQVIGLPHNRLGEEVCACVRVEEGAKVTLEDVVEHCKGKIASFKIPSQLKIVEKFPKTASGKIQKFKLVEECKHI